MFLIVFIVAGTLTGRAALAHVGRSYRYRRDMYMRYSRRQHPRWGRRRHRAAARWAAGMYTASNVAHGFPDLRRGVQQGWHAHRTASTEARARHLRDIAEYRRRHAAALDQIRHHQQTSRPRNDWRDATTLGGLGDATAGWLEGNGTSAPAYAPGHGPDTETAGLVPALAALNRAGFVTRQSQPGYDGTGADGARWRQRAAVEGFTDQETAERIRADGEAAGLLVIVHDPADRPRWRDNTASNVDVTRRGDRVTTDFGGQYSRHHVADGWTGYGETGAVDAVNDAWEVTIIDPEWGRDDRLWPVLAGATGTTDEDGDEPGAAATTDEVSDAWETGPDAVQYNAVGAPQSRRADGRPETAEDTEFFDLRESGYDGPIVSKNGHARRPDMDDPQEAEGVAILDRMRQRAAANGHTGSGQQAGETNGGDAAITTAGEEMPTGTVGTGEVTGYEAVLAATQEYKKVAEQEKDNAAAQRQEAAALKQSAENLVDSLQGHELDSQTISEAADLLEAADGLDASAGEREAAADRLSNAADTLATGLESRHGALADAHKSAPVAPADKEFYMA